MSNITFIPAHPRNQRDALIHLNIEYMSWVATEIERYFGTSTQELSGMSVAQYVPEVLDHICGENPPHGIFYLIEAEGVLAGMGGLRDIGTGTAEIKRLYIRPSHRGLQLGNVLLQRLLDDARSFGYNKVCLDTGPFMHHAHRLYEAMGFIDCAPYEESEVPALLRHDWRFMARSLSPAKTTSAT